MSTAGPSLPSIAFAGQAKNSNAGETRENGARLFGWSAIQGIPSGWWFQSFTHFSDFPGWLVDELYNSFFFK